MGSRGPAPKRASERHGHRAKADQPSQLEQSGDVEIPEAREGWHSTAAGWYAALAASGQSRFYEPSDWQNAHYCAELIHQSLTGEKVNAQLIAQIRGLMTDLLVTEGARRRVGLEIVRKPVDGEQPTTAGNVTRMEDRRKRVSDAS